MQKFIRIAKNTIHLLDALAANIYYRFPSRSIKIIGVTGTDGKSTTTHMVFDVLKTAKKKVSMISSIYAFIGGVESDTGFHVTTPNPWALQRMIRQAADHGDEYLVLEVTSHGLDQNRVWGISFEVGVLTNVTREHLDYHRTYERYLQAKLKLLERSRFKIVNIDDASYKKIADVRFAVSELETYGLTRGDVNATSISVSTAMPGEFNLSNALAAYSVCRNIGIAEGTITKALSRFDGMSGRFEYVYKGDFKVIVDFAHTANGMLEVLKAVRKIAKKRLILVFGCAAKRDIDKRPVMGRYAVEYADVVVLTEEDYRDEDVHDIMNQIEMGAKQSSKLHVKNYELFKIEDRQKAVTKAIENAQKGDVVLLTGKGHERSLCRGTKEYPWSEHEAVKKALKLKVTS